MIRSTTAPVPLIVATAPSRLEACRRAVHVALPGVAALLPPVVVAAATETIAKEDGVRVAARVLSEALAPQSISLVAPFPSILAALRAGVRTMGGWRAVDLGERGERLRQVELPATLVDAGSLVVVTDLSAEPSRRPVVALGVWARYVRPLQRLGAWLSSGRDSLAPEIALAVSPRLILLFDRWRGRALVAATSDQIAAELAGLALYRVRGQATGEALGPWEDPLVQRATELELGVRWPEAIALHGIWADDPDDPARADFDELVAGVAAALGIAAWTGSDHLQV